MHPIRFACEINVICSVFGALSDEFVPIKLIRAHSGDDDFTGFDHLPNRIGVSDIDLEESDMLANAHLCASGSEFVQ
jgi:hypothetical protein